MGRVRIDLYNLIPIPQCNMNRTQHMNINVHPLLYAIVWILGQWLSLYYYIQEVTQSAGTTPNEAEVSSSNPPPLSCVNMSKKKKKIKEYGNLNLERIDFYFRVRMNIRREMRLVNAFGKGKTKAIHPSFSFFKHSPAFYITLITFYYIQIKNHYKTIFFFFFPY